MEYFIRKENSGNVMVDKGILACKLKNGNVVQFYIGNGRTLTMTMYALDYYKINYKNNGEALFPLFATEA